MSVETLSPIEDSRIVWRFSHGAVVLAAFIAVLGVLPFWDGLTIMWKEWSYPEYSHSFLIPLVALFLVWQQKDRLELASFAGSWVGVALVGFGGVLLVLGQLGTVYTLVEYAYLLTMYGLVLALLGYRAVRLIAAPLLILFLMIPLPTFIFANLSAKLQLLSSMMGVWFMRLFGISVYAEGNVIDLGGYKLQVAEACDGLRYLFPLMTLGFLIAYFYKGAFWKRLVLFVSSFPITVIMNSFRIGTIGVMVEHWGIQTAEGFLHEFQGWVVFMASAALMIGEMALLNRVGHERSSWRRLFGVELPGPTPQSLPRRQRKIPAAFWAACATLVLIAGVAVISPRPTEIIPTRQAFTGFPMEIGGWTGKRESLDGVYLDVLRLDDYVLANYSNGKGSPVNLYIAYYNSQRKGEAVHSPRACLPGGGWVLSEFNQTALREVSVGTHPLRVNRTLISLGEQRELVYYWFQQRDRIITNEFAVKWYLFWDAVTRHRTDGALVRLIVQLPPGASVAGADGRLVDFAKQLAPVLPHYVPN
jgi:exosortase D (VPLPA-CTERM-specific)